MSRFFLLTYLLTGKMITIISFHEHHILPSLMLKLKHSPNRSHIIISACSVLLISSSTGLYSLSHAEILIKDRICPQVRLLLWTLPALSEEGKACTQESNHHSTCEFYNAFVTDLPLKLFVFWQKGHLCSKVNMEVVFWFVYSRFYLSRYSGSPFSINIYVSLKEGHFHRPNWNN